MASAIKHQYNPTDHLKNITCFRGTALEYVLTSKNFWALQVKHTLIFVGWAFCSEEIRAGIEQHWILRSGYLTSLGSLVVFTIVFYAGNCYTAYKELFRLSVDCRKELIYFTGHLKGLFANTEDVWGSVRHLLAAQNFFYFDLKHPLGEKDPEWDQFKTGVLGNKLLSDAEFKMIVSVQKNKNNRVTMLTTWAEAAFLRISKQNPNFTALPPPCQSQYLGRMLGASEKLQHFLLSTVDVKEFGVPFIYHHIVHLLVNLFLVFLSVSSIFVDTVVDVNYWTMITYPLVCFVTMGILSSADAMADPFGEDDCDFDLMAVTQGTLNDARTICEMIETDEALLKDNITLDPSPKPPAAPAAAPALALPTPPAPNASQTAFLPARREQLAQNGEAGLDAARKMMGLVSAVVRVLAESSTEQQAVLQECDRRMLAVLGERPSSYTYDSDRHKGRRRVYEGHVGRPPTGKPPTAQVDRVKRRDKEGVEMSSRRMSGNGSHGVYDVDNSLLSPRSPRRRPYEGDRHYDYEHDSSDNEIIPVDSVQPHFEPTRS